DLGIGALEGMNVLVVDDSEDTTEMVRHLLEIGGATVSAATSGKEALQLAREKQFDVVLSDISMPEMDGFEFLSKLRKLPGKKDVPAVALTGFGRPEDVQRACNEGLCSPHQAFRHSDPRQHLAKNATDNNGSLKQI